MENSLTRARIPLGKHQFEFVGPHFLLRSHGEFTTDELEEAIKHLVEFSQGGKFLTLTCFDATHFTTLGPDARKMLVERLRTVESAGFVYRTGMFGLSFHSRVLINFTLKGLSLVSGQTRFTTIHANEAEAMAWLQHELADFTNKRTP